MEPDSSIGLVLHILKCPEGPENPICMGISRYFVLADFSRAQILSDGLPTISGVRSMGGATPEKFSAQKIEVSSLENS